MATLTAPRLSRQPQTLRSSVPGSPTYTSDPTHPKRFISPPTCSSSCPAPGVSRAHLDPGQAGSWASSEYFPLAVSLCLPPFLFNPSPTSVVSTTSHNHPPSHLSIPLPLLSLRPSLFQPGSLLSPHWPHLRPVHTNLYTLASHLPGASPLAHRLRGSQQPGCLPV